jgi:hypothetical protein
MGLALAGGSHTRARWAFLRILGLVFLSAFASLVPQVLGLVGREGILPLGRYLAAVSAHTGPFMRFWYAPSLLWALPGDRGLMALALFGVLSSVLLILNVWPRWMVAASTLLFLSFISIAQDFASYQSDGMLMEAGVAAFFLAPSGFRPGFGGEGTPSRLARLFLLWEWFRIYFESGLGKILGGDPEWRHLTAMDHYYEYGPLPTVLAFWVQKLPHTFHAGTALFVLLFECVFVFAAFLPKPFRLATVGVSSLLQVGIQATANYTFLNLLVFGLGLLLLEDRDLRGSGEAAEPEAPSRPWTMLAGVVFSLGFYVTALSFPLVPLPFLPRPLLLPLSAAQPFPLTGRYGLFAVMTRERNEIEFQGSTDGKTWSAYPFRFKPQALDRAPGIYAPFHPRFDWNLWFASLGTWEESPWVELVEERLLEGSPHVLALFARDPFSGTKPRLVRAVISSYSFTDWAEWRATGRYWRREGDRLYAPLLESSPDGAVLIREMPRSP